MKRTLAEMAVIFLIAAAMGIAWNHKLLRRAWTDNAPGSAPTDAATQLEAKVPLPLGLIQVKELYERREAIFVDARDEKTFAAGHITGAVTLPLGKTESGLPKFRGDVPVGQPLVVYCNGYDCHDSRDLATRLLAAGYRTVYVFEGGYPEWRDAGYPTTVAKQ